MTMTDNTEPLPSEAAEIDALRAENARLRAEVESLKYVLDLSVEDYEALLTELRTHAAIEGGAK